MANKSTNNNKPLKFHWRLLQGGEGTGITRALQHEVQQTALPDVKAQQDFCKSAESSGIESLLVDFSYGKPDPLLLATALALQTEKAKFMIAVRSGLLSPTLFVQQVNTFSALTAGNRISLNVVAGYSPQEQRYYGDFLSHDERYARAEEFLAICNSFWNKNEAVNYDGKYFKIEDGRLNTPFLSKESSRPYIFIGGGSQLARDLANKQGDCWIRFADTPENLVSSIEPVLKAGKEVGLRLSVIARATKKEAVNAAKALVENLDDVGTKDIRNKEEKFVNKSDSVSIKEMYENSEKEWLSDNLWAGAVRTHGSPLIALVGTPEEIASEFIRYKKIGVTQFILLGWPKLEEMINFGKNIIPLIRKMENN